MIFLLNFCIVIFLAVKITLAAQDVQTLKVVGKNSNLSEVFARIMDYGNGIIPYVRPDLTVFRKLFANSIVFVIETQNGKQDSTASKQQALRTQLSSVKEKLEDEARARLVRSQHDRKVQVILDFLEDHYLTTNYLYDEVKRIMTQRMVKDDLRKMVEYLEKPGRSKMKEEVLKCYRHERKSERFTTNREYKTNNLVINVMKDPFNDGFIN